MDHQKEKLQKRTYFTRPFNLVRDMWVIDFVGSAPSPKWRALSKLQYFVSLEEKVSAVLENAEINVEIVPDGTCSCLDLNYLLHLPKLPTVLVSLKPEFSAICVWNPAVIRSGGNQTHQWGEYVLCVWLFVFPMRMTSPLSLRLCCSSQPHFSSLRRNPICVFKQHQHI